MFHSPQITPEERPPATLQPQIILTAEQSQLSCPAKQEIITVDEFPTALHGRPAALQQVSVDLAPAFLSSAEREFALPLPQEQKLGVGVSYVHRKSILKCNQNEQAISGLLL